MTSKTYMVHAYTHFFLTQLFGLVVSYTSIQLKVTKIENWYEKERKMYTTCIYKSIRTKMSKFLMKACV